MPDHDASWRDRLLGARDWLGWWTLPVFLLVGLTGAVLAGSLATVYYGQQVNALEEETSASRAELRGAVEDVQRAREEALGSIEAEVDAVRDALTRELPFEDVTTTGVVVLRAVTGGPGAQQRPDSPAGGGTPQGAVVAQEEQPTEQPTEQPDQERPAEEPSSTEQPPAPAEPPAERPREERTAVGFAVATDGGTTFIATVHSLIADPEAPGGVVGEVDVVTPRGATRGVVHSWDAGRDLALIRADIGDAVELLSWRPNAEGLVPGERIVAAGVTPTLNTVQVSGRIAYSDVTVLVSDLPRIDFLRGSPIVDQRGLVVGIYSTAYAPFGAAAGRDQAAIPVQLLCERMLRNCEALEAPPED